MTPQVVQKTGRQLHSFAKNVLQYDKAWVVFVAGCSGLLLLYSLIKLPFVLGHDVYFHIHATEVIAQHFPNLPTTIPHYWNGLDFGYPPLLHYVIAWLSLATSLDIATIFKLTPAILVPIAILLVYLLYKTRNSKVVVVAVAVYVMLIPFHWALFAGEYPRMLAAVFSIAFLYFYEKSKQSPIVIFVLFSMLCAGMAMLSNMISVGVIGTFLAYELVKNFIERKSLFRIIAIGIGSLIIASPWILHTVQEFGWLYLVDVLQIHQSAINPALSVFFIVGFIVIYLRIRKKLPDGLYIWFILAFMWAKPSSWSIPAALIIAEIIATPIKSWISRYSLSVQAVLISLSLLIISYMTSGTYIYIDEYLNTDVASAAEWMKTNTNQDASIIAFLPVHSTSFDSINTLVDRITAVTRDENLPYFTNRQTYTWFGYEWNTDQYQIDTYDQFQNKVCALEFLETVVNTGVRPDYLWFNKDSFKYPESDLYCNDFEEPQFTTVYENERILIKNYVKDDCDCE